MTLHDDIAEETNSAVSNELIRLIKKARTDDLFLVVKSSELQDITRLLDTSTKASLKNEIARISVIGAEHKKSQAILASFTEGPSIPIYVLGVIAGSVTLASTSLILLTGGIFLLMLMAATIHAVGTYQELKDKNDEDRKLLQFTQFRIACANELLARLHKEVKEQDQAQKTVRQNTVKSSPARQASYSKLRDYSFNIPMTTNDKAPLLGTRLTPQIRKKKIEKAPWLPRFKDSLGTSFVLGLIFFESYYLSAIALSQALALASVATVLTGGIGLGVALGITILISAYLGYKHYQHNKQREGMQREQEEAQKELTRKFKECCDLKEQLNHNIRSGSTAPCPLEFENSMRQKPIPNFNSKRNAMYYAQNVHHLFKSSQKLLMRRNLRTRNGGLAFRSVIRRP